MKPRASITLLSGATAWPLAANAQRKSSPIVCFLNPGPRSKGQAATSAFREGLREAGYEEGQNVAVEYRWAHAQIDRLQALANDLVARGVVAIVAGAGSWVAPTGLDPLRAGMIKSLNRSEANLTGATFYSGGSSF